jgi:hypothetical protein
MRSSIAITVKRVDDFFTAHHVMADVWRGIWGARAILADCTGRNPNVFYEIGVAHTIGRPVVLITQNGKMCHLIFSRSAICSTNLHRVEWKISNSASRRPSKLC